MQKENIVENTIDISSWVNDYSDLLFDWAYHKVSNKEVAEDLVQDTFLSAFQNIEKFRGESKPKTWLFTILNNKIIDYYRKSSRKEVLIDTSSSENAFAVTESFFDEDGGWKQENTNDIWGNDNHLLDDSDFNKIMKICMDDLPSNWRNAINFKYIFDKDPKLICQELNITMSNYWQLIHRAKLLLKKCLEINYFKQA